MECLQCNGEFEPKRSTAKFCSDACKKRYARSVVPLSEVKSVPLKSFNKPKYPQGQCHNCGKQEPVAWEGLMCICLDCTNKGVTHESLGLDRRACA